MGEARSRRCGARCEDSLPSVRRRSRSRSGRRRVTPQFCDGPVETGSNEDRLLSWDQVEHIASISRSTAWRMERDGAFPHRVRVSPGRVGWWESELTNWKRSRTGELPAPPSRKPTRSPRLPGMARSMPRPKAAAPRAIPQEQPAPDRLSPEPAARAQPKRALAKRTGSVDQIDFGF